MTDLEIFAAVVREGSFTKAARRLQTSKSRASREVARLEDRLGARLLQRTTRRLSLTDVGRAFFDRCVVILEQVEEAELAVGELQTVPVGVLKVSVPASYGRLVIMERLHDFAARYPRVQLDLTFTDRRVDLVAEGIDVAIRIGDLPDSSLFARRLDRMGFQVCASPDYLEQRAAPEHPTELGDHSCLEFTHRYHRGTWDFMGPDGPVSVRVEGRVCADSGEALVSAACRGLGIVYVPEFLVWAPLEAGALTPLLTDWVPPPTGVWALYPHNRHLSPKVRLLVDALVEADEDALEG